MIDFHSHLDLYPDPPAVAKRCSDLGIYVLSVTTTPSAWEGTSALVVPGSRVRTGLGLHPQLAHQRKSELEIFNTYLPDTLYVGEIGLDGAPDFKMHWSDQIAVFDHILHGCSLIGGRIMSIHSRRATSAALDRLEAFPNAGISILHWFSGNKRELDRAISLKCWFSVGPAMFLTNNSRYIISKMPRERILTETDGPFVQVDGRSAMPWDAQRAVAQLAALWKIPLEDVEQQLSTNLLQLTSTL